MRLIDADKIKLPQGFFEKVDNVPKFYEWLDEQPTVDAVPLEDYKSMEQTVCKLTKAIADAEPVKHGHWITQFDDLFPMESTIECSACGEKEWMMTIINHNYCPNCGAKMDEEGEDA